MPQHTPNQTWMLLILQPPHRYSLAVGEVVAKQAEEVVQRVFENRLAAHEAEQIQHGR